MKTFLPSQLPLRFQKLFSIVSVVFYVAYSGSYIALQLHNYALSKRDLYLGYTSWDMVNAIAAAALPVILFSAGVAMCRGGVWRRMVAGSLWAMIGLLGYVAVQILLAATSLYGLLAYPLQDIVASLGAVLLVMGVGLVVYRRRSLWTRRYVLFVSFVGVVAILMYIDVIVSQFQQGTQSVVGWPGILLPPVIITVLAAVAYRVMRGLVLSERLFRVVLVMACAVMGLYLASAVPIFAASSDPAAVNDVMASSVYLYASFIMPISLYVAAALLARPIRQGTRSQA